MQDIAPEVPGCLQHHRGAARYHSSHTVQCSLLGRSAQTSSLRVNSCGHQGTEVVAPDFVVTARVAGGVTQATRFGFGSARVYPRAPVEDTYQGTGVVGESG